MVRDADIVRESVGVRVTETVLDTLSVMDTLGENDPDGQCVTDSVSDGDCELDRHRDTVFVSDAMDGDGDGVPRLGAQNGPMLNVARCVPSME